MGARLSTGVRTTGVENNVLSTDLGRYSTAGRGRSGAVRRPFLDAGFTDEEVQHDGRGKHPQAGRRGRPVSRRIQVIGAHSADFVWRAGGAIAKAVELGGAPRWWRSPTASAASRASSGSRKARRSRRQEGPPLRGRAARHELGARSRALDLGHYPLADRRHEHNRDRRDDREFAPDVLVTTPIRSVQTVSSCRTNAVDTRARSPPARACRARSRDHAAGCP